MNVLSRVLSLVILVCQIAEAREYFVSPSGNDSNPGTLEKPFGTLIGARDAIRSLSRNERRDNIFVNFRGGQYVLKQTAVLSLDDGAPDGFKIYYQAYQDESPVFSSAVPVTGWVKLDRYPEALPEAAKGNVWVASIPEEAGNFFTLYRGEKRLHRARSKGFKPLILEKSEGIDPKSNMRFPKGALKAWPNIEDVELLILPVHWTMNILPLAAVDEEKQIATTAIRGTGALGPTKLLDPSAWVENVVDYLDEPGEWVVNTRERQIYYWPEHFEPEPDICIPTLKELVKVEGGIDINGPVDAPVKNLVFKGLTFMHGERDLWAKDHGGWGVQHDWEFFDRPSALLRFRGAEDCVVEGCRFTSSGGTAIRLDLHCQRIVITGNLIEHMGNLGILLCGYGPGTKDVNKRNGIINNHIRHVGELYWHGHGVFIWQSGDNLVSHNLIHHGPRKAVGISGVRHGSFNKELVGEAECSRTIRWDEIPEDALGTDNWQNLIPYLHATDNIVEYNEVHHMLQKLADGTALNVSGAGKGNIIRRNYLHHFYNPNASGAMRPDGWQIGTRFAENVLYKTGPFRHKSHNHFENNILIDLIRIVHPMYIAFQGFPEEDVLSKPEEGSRILFNVMYKSAGDVEFYRTKGWVFKHTTFVEHCWSNYNIFYHASDPSKSVEELERWKERGSDRQSLSADPMFVNIEENDFRFKPGSPALKLGIKSLDVREMGLLASFPEKYR